MSVSGEKWNMCTCVYADCVRYVLPPWEAAFRCTCPSSWRSGDHCAKLQVPTPLKTIFDTAYVNRCCVETGSGRLLKACCKRGCSSLWQRTRKRSQYSQRELGKISPMQVFVGGVRNWKLFRNFPIQSWRLLSWLHLVVLIAFKKLLNTKLRQKRQFFFK